MTTKSALLAALLLTGLIAPARAGGDALPGAPFDASRYQTLWESSPFAVATPVAVESEEYKLVGIAQFDGISYASLVENNQNADHFVVTSEKPVHGLSIVSIVRGQNADSTYATLKKDGAILKLKLETNAPAGSAAPPVPTAAPVVQNMPATAMPPGFPPGFHRRPPRARLFSTPIFVPRPPPNSP